MENVIDDLYFGRITPCDRCSTPEENELMGRISECFDNLSEGLIEEQRIGLENFKDYLMEVSVISEREMFEYGLQLGMRLMVEVMTARSVKRELGDDFILSSALNASHANYSRECIASFDTVELMSYDYYEENGDHATFRLTEEHVRTVLEMGFPLEKINLGLPFYARPSDNSAYWYDWGQYYDKVDGSRYYHCPETGKRFYFNDEALIYQKTKFAIQQQLGGMMIWHYSSDAPSDSGYSLFSAIQRAKDDAGIR